MLSTSVRAQIRLPRLISNGMVLQRDTQIKLWGWAAPSEKVLLKFKNRIYSNIAGADGKWQIVLPKEPAGGPYEMTFIASNEITIQNILFGDVWVCSGQSNMEITMERVQDKYFDIIEKVHHTKIRQYLVPDVYNFETKAEDLQGGEWIEADQEHVLKFSAVGYFFATELFKKYNVPIGLINSALGGSPAEAWISEEALKAFPEKFKEAQLWKDKDLIKRTESDNQATSHYWFANLNATDVGIKEHWQTTSPGLTGWSDIVVPGFWLDAPLQGLHGAVWYKKEISIPKSLIGKPAKLLLGRIVDADSVFINGHFTGATGYQYPPRRYLMPPGILCEGKNEITVSIICNSGTCGFVPDKPYELIIGSDTIALSGTWKYKIGSQTEALPAATFVRWKPVGLYNAMIAPLTNFAIKGVLWYQGESNTKKPSEYFDLVQTLIKDWRSAWHQGEFPFLIVQLPNFMKTTSEPSESSWAELREAQLKLLATNNTALIVTIDVGEWNDIHPLNKQAVGHRLALQAMRLAYKEPKLISSGPIIKAARRDGNKISLRFKEIGKGLCSSDNRELSYFSIAGPDNKFVWAKAKITDDELVVWSDLISNPVSVRYAWADNPEGANLANREKLPASPFWIKIR